MPNTSVLVFEDGVTIQPELLLSARSKVGLEKALRSYSRKVAVNAASLNCPISTTGNLNTAELYLDGKVASLRYCLPVYRLGISQHSEVPFQRYDIKLTLTPDVNQAGRLWVRLKGEMQKSADPGQVTEIKPVPHSVRVSLRYLAGEKADAPGAMSTWKSVAFEQVEHRNYVEIEAVATLRSLPEVDAVHRALSDPQARCQLLVQCEADLAFKNKNQVFVPKRNNLRAVAEISNPHLRKAVAVQPDYSALMVTAVHHNAIPQVQPQVQPQVTPNVANVHRVSPGVAFDARISPNVVRMRAPISPAIRADQPGVGAAINRGAIHGRNPTADAAIRPEVLHGQIPIEVQPDALRLIGKKARPTKYFADDQGEPAYTPLHLFYEQQVDLNFDPGLHGYVYPPRPPASGPSLVRCEVPNPNPLEPADRFVIYQDAVERHIFYYVPDEFRLTRDEVRAPTYKPSLQVAFFSVANSSPDEGGQTEQETTEFGVQFGFRAVPYLRPNRETDARRFIEANPQLTAGMPPSLLPLSPEWASLVLNLPSTGAGNQLQERPEATVKFDKYIADNLTLSSSQFAEIFNSMRIGGETLTGAVRYRLPGSTQVKEATFTGRLDSMVGPVLDAESVDSDPADPHFFRVRIRNGIESKVRLRQAAVLLLENPESHHWVLSAIVGNTLPIEIAPGTVVEVRVEPGSAMTRAFGVRLIPLAVDVEIDFQELWRSVLATPGWDDVVQEVTVNVDSSLFTGANHLDKVKVTFNLEEATVELTAANLQQKVKLMRPFLPFLLRLPTADDYFYKVESWRNSSEGGPLVKVAEREGIRHEGPVLTVSPPLS